MRIGIGVVLACGTTLALAGGARGQTKDPVQADVQRLSDRAIVVRARIPQSTNVIALASQAGLVVIDTGVSPTFAEPIRKAIEESFGRSDFAYVINTHHHGDHSWGNQVFGGATILGVEGVFRGMEEQDGSRQQTAAQIPAGLSHLRQALEGMGPDSDEARAMAGQITYYEGLLSGIGEGFKLTPPTMTFSDRMTLRLGDLTVEAVYYGYSHSDSDILVFCPEEDLVATGDIFAPGVDPYVDSDRALVLDRWLENLDSVLDGSSQPSLIVPGHGDLLSRDDLLAARGFVAEKRAELDGKESAFFAFREAFQEEGLEAGLARMDELHARPERFYFFHAEFDSYVYRLMLADDLDGAIPLFEKLSVLFPQVPNAWDSLGEAYLRRGDQERAATAFERCLELDPDHENAARQLQEIRGEG